MKIKLNGQDCEIDAANRQIAGGSMSDGSMSLKVLIAEKGLNENMLVVEYNGNILPRDSWDKTFLKDGDTIELLSFVGGG